jgi:hypothetical protein
MSRRLQNRLYQRDPTFLGGEPRLPMTTDATPKGRPRTVEQRVAPLQLAGLRRIGALLETVAARPDDPLRNDAEQLAALCGAAIFHVEQRAVAVKPGRPRSIYKVERPSRETVMASGAAEVARLLGRGINYVNNQVSRGGGQWRFQCTDEHGNPCYGTVTRLGTEHASSKTHAK